MTFGVGPVPILAFNVGPANNSFDPTDQKIPPIDMFNDSLTLTDEEIVEQQKSFDNDKAQFDSQAERASSQNIPQTIEFSLSMDIDEEVEYFERSHGPVANRDDITLPDLSEGIEVEFTEFDFIDINAQIK
jgi:hypothetical protein